MSYDLDQLQWHEIRTMLRYIFKDSQVKILIFIDGEYSNAEKLRIIEEFHNSPMGGHEGVSRTIKRVKQYYTWKGLKKVVQAYIASCSSCQKNKSNNTTTHQPMVITTTASKPFERIYLDIVGPLTVSEKQNSYILTIQDDLTKFSSAFPLHSHDAQNVAKALVEGFICQHGIPEIILTDCGTKFLSKLFKECCKLLEIEKLNTTPYHPQTNGSLERSYRTLAEYLRHYVDKDHKNWDNYIPYAMFVYNTTVHLTTKNQPYELVYGFPAVVPQVQVGNNVWIKNHQQKGKLGTKWLGPFKVTCLHENENISIQRGRKEVKIHKNEIKIAK
ncbi:hypothetical protein QTP88_007560 [Uroleucon formosanum]